MPLARPAAGRSSYDSISRPPFFPPLGPRVMRWSAVAMVWPVLGNQKGGHNVTTSWECPQGASSYLFLSSYEEAPRLISVVVGVQNTIAVFYAAKASENPTKPRRGGSS